jgi:hypothetical protein
LVPDVSTPVNVKTVIEAATDLERVAVTETLVSGVDEKARQISVVPGCPLARTTRTHVSPAPATEFTAVVPLVGPSVATNARNSSLPAPVEKVGVAIVVLDVERPVVLLASIVTAAEAAVDVHIMMRQAAERDMRFIMVVKIGQENTPESVA